MRTRTLLFSAFLLGATPANAQTVATFEDLPLSTVDTYYVNLSAPGTDVGFHDGLAHFPCIYDTSGGSSYWNYCVYTNETDSVTSGYGNQYSAKTGIGYGGSAKYVVVYCANPATYAYTMNLPLTGAAIGQAVSGFYVTNSTYAFNAIRDGGYPATKFHDGDWFLLTIKGFHGGALTADSVNFYLADYRFADSASNYIVNTWQWVNLAPLGHVDSLQFSLNSSDTGSFGMNTPGYFCMDNFTTDETAEGVKTVQPTLAKVYPIPAVNILNVDMIGSGQELQVLDITGNVVLTTYAAAPHTEINMAPLAPGSYELKITGNGNTGTVKFVKQ